MDIQSLLNSTIQIPTLPTIAVEILDAVRDEDASFERLSTVVSSDPALAAKVLKAANSSFYGLRTNVSSIKQAISILGLNALKNLALSFAIAESMQRIADSQFDFELFWRRSVTAALAADILAKHLKQKNDEAFVCGLLLDIGVLILYYCRKEEYGKIFDEKKVADLPIAILEKKVFGFDHQELGAAVLDQWGLPLCIVEPIRYHHETGEVPAAHRVQTHIVQIADRISAVYHGTHTGFALQAVKAMLKDRYRIDEGAAQSLVDAVAEQSNEIFSLFELGSEHLRPISQLLQEANQELARLNITYDHLVLEYRRRNERAEKLAQSLKAANKRLRTMAMRDDLTGLFNQRHFLISLETELQRALRYQRALTLALLDIDQFHRINAQHGYWAGDILLKIIGAALAKVTRNTDLLARYRGDIFAIICPETDLQAAAAIVERIRKGIEQVVMPIGGKMVKVTVSTGIAGYAPANGPKTSGQLLDTAEQALCQSKTNGRKRVSMFPCSPGMHLERKIS